MLPYLGTYVGKIFIPKKLTLSMQLMVRRCDIVVETSLCLLATVFHYRYPYKRMYVMDLTFAEDTVACSEAYSEPCPNI